MNILRFINSKDIREHLKKLDYEFSSLEAAWLIYQCREATLEEKHKAWRELIETMPDCSIPERMNTVAQDSLHGFLKKYMALEDKLVERFCGDGLCDTYTFNKPCVFRIRYKYKDGTVFEFPAVFSQFDVLYETVMEPDKNVVSIILEKYQIDSLRPPACAELTPDLKFLFVDPWELDDKEESDVFFGVFEGLWFDFPTPFKKGDIVWDPRRPENKGYTGGPFVLKETCLEGLDPEVAERMKKDGDTSDMNVRGYFAGEHGDIWNEVTDNYMDLEYYEKELKGASRVLIPLSRFLKGEIDVELYARAYHQIRMQYYAELCIPPDRTRDELILSGLEMTDRTPTCSKKNGR